MKNLTNSEIKTVSGGGGISIACQVTDKFGNTISANFNFNDINSLMSFFSNQKDDSDANIDKMSCSLSFDSAKYEDNEGTMSVSGALNFSGHLK